MSVKVNMVHFRTQGNLSLCVRNDIGEPGLHNANIIGIVSAYQECQFGNKNASIMIMFNLSLRFKQLDPDLLQFHFIDYCVRACTHHRV